MNPATLSRTGARVADTIEIPEARRAPLARILDTMDGAERIVVTTHVNADGDGAGSEAALAAWLAGRGKDVTIVNPTPFPATYLHLVDDPARVKDFGTPDGERALDEADLIVVVDTAEPRRLGRMVKRLQGRSVIIVDHHPPGDEALPGFRIQDASACATGELIFDLLRLAGEDGRAAWPDPVAEALYTAIVSDTGSFRYANTTPRTHAIAAELMRRGVDPEAVYRRLFATAPLRRIRLLREALDRLDVDPELPITWITLPNEVLKPLDTRSEDLDGIIEYARMVEGTEVALLFRETPDGATKVSFRSNGDVDVNELARRFGGGGHVKASGAVVGRPLAVACNEILDATREAVRSLEKYRNNG